MAGSLITKLRKAFRPMEETEYALRESYQVAITTTQVYFTVTNIGPTRAFERWNIRLFAVRTVSSTGELITSGDFTVYRGTVSDGLIVAQTRTPGADTSVENLDLEQGEFITAAWRSFSGTATGTLRVEGKRYVKGRRAY